MSICVSLSDRIDGVWSIHRGRGRRRAARDRTFGAYVVALISGLYAVPAGVLVTQELGTIVDRTDDSNMFGAALGVAAACWLAALAVGRVWGPLVLPPFVLHVLLSTDLLPWSFVSRLAARRLSIASAAVTVPGGLFAITATRVGEDPRTAVPLIAGTLLVAATTACCWLIGQVGSPLALAAVAMSSTSVMAVAVVAPSTGSSSIPVIALLAGVAVVVGWSATHSIHVVSAERLARDSHRATQASLFTATGTFHDALDLYRPVPVGLRHALRRRDGSLRGPFLQGAVRALRTPARAGIGATCLLAGSIATVIGVGWTTSTGTPWSGAVWTVGAVLVYLGAGWVSETWRSLRDELHLPALLGPRSRHAGVRHTSWPVAATSASGVVGGVTGIVLMNTTATPGGGSGATTATISMASTFVIALAARFLREMKVQFPIELLTPVMTPFGDLSGLRVLAWQLDGLLTVLVAVGLLAVVPPAAGAAVAVPVVAACLWVGLARVGPSPSVELLRLWHHVRYRWVGDEDLAPRVRRR